MSMFSTSLPGGTWALGGLTVTRFGYGAMQLAGPGVMGPPADRDSALAVLREAARLGITHIDTSNAYGPRLTSQLIREALHPYPQSLHIVTKVGATRDQQARSRALAVRRRRRGGAGFPEGRDVAADSAVSALPDGASGGAGRRGTPSFASRPRQPQG